MLFAFVDVEGCVQIQIPFCLFLANGLFVVCGIFALDVLSIKSNGAFAFLRNLCVSIMCHDRFGLCAFVIM